EKMSQPRYQGLLDAQIPQVTLPSGAGIVRVIAGEFMGTRGAAKTVTPINAWDIQLEANATLDLQFEDGHTAVLVVQSGAVGVNDSPAKAVELVLFDRKGSNVELHAEVASRLLVLTGEPIG